jgi:hypothetical protein
MVFLRRAHQFAPAVGRIDQMLGATAVGFQVGKLGDYIASDTGHDEFS